ncbi:MAG: hypothetical protein ACI89L_000447 [Phycisphaerales bacterium]|jgi:hypothetical protein
MTTSWTGETTSLSKKYGDGWLSKNDGNSKFEGDIPEDLRRHFSPMIKPPGE